MEEIDLLFFRMKRLMNINEPFEARHRYLLDRLSHVGAPFGLKGVDLSSLKMPHREQQKPYVKYKHPDTPRVSQWYEYERRVD